MEVLSFKQRLAVVLSIIYFLLVLVLCKGAFTFDFTSFLIWIQPLIMGWLIYYGRGFLSKKNIKAVDFIKDKENRTTVAIYYNLIVFYSCFPLMSMFGINAKIGLDNYLLFGLFPTLAYIGWYKFPKSISNGSEKSTPQMSLYIPYVYLCFICCMSGPHLILSGFRTNDIIGTTVLLMLGIIPLAILWIKNGKGHDKPS